MRYYYANYLHNIHFLSPPLLAGEGGWGVRFLGQRGGLGGEVLCRGEIFDLTFLVILHLSDKQLIEISYIVETFDLTFLVILHLSDKQLIEISYIVDD